LKRIEGDDFLEFGSDTIERKDEVFKESAPDEHDDFKFLRLLMAAPYSFIDESSSGDSPHPR
jgi:hypothetical protein